MSKAFRIMFDSLLLSNEIKHVDLDESANNGTGYLNGIQMEADIQLGFDSFKRKYIALKVVDDKGKEGLAVFHERFNPNPNDVVVVTSMGDCGHSIRAFFSGAMAGSMFTQIEDLIFDKTISTLRWDGEEVFLKGVA